MLAKRSGSSAARSWTSDGSTSTWYSSQTSSSNGAMNVLALVSAVMGPSGLNVTAFQPSW